MTDHSVIPPSSAGIWGKPEGCTGWVGMTELYPEVGETVESREGTAAHEIGCDIITAAKQGFIRTFDHYIGRTASNGIVFTEEMYDSARIYADDVIATMRKYAIFDDHLLGIESRVTAPSVHFKSFGTVDSHLFAKSHNAMYVWDFKHGHGVVEAFENWQGINYVAGLINKFDLNGLDDQIINVHIRIVQPRAFHRDGVIREWVVKMSDLRGYINALNTNAHRALDPALAVTRTGSHCKNCSARHACTAAIECGVNLYEIAIKPTPVDMSIEAIGVQYGIVKRAREQMEYLESALDEIIKSQITSGVNVPGWTVETGVGRERWTKTGSEVIQLGQLLGLDFKKEDKPITPNQARKLGADESVINAYSEKPNTGIKIVRDDLTKARRIFGSNH